MNAVQVGRGPRVRAPGGRNLPPGLTTRHDEVAVPSTPVVLLLRIAEGRQSSDERPREITCRFRHSDRGGEQRIVTSIPERPLRRTLAMATAAPPRYKRASWGSRTIRIAIPPSLPPSLPRS